MSDDQGVPPPEDQPPEEASSEAESAESPEDTPVSDGEGGAGSEDEALAAAMAAVSQVQGVADSATAHGAGTDDAQPFASPEFGNELSDGPKSGIDMLSDVHMDVRIELGRTNMYVEDVLRLNEGAVVELDKLAGDPVDVFVNNRRVARGEVLVLNDMFCVRINEVVDIAQDDQ
jgi:flagellar motor switch protein FliN/FliY